MKYLHTMVRVRDLDASLAFFRDALGLKEVRRSEHEAGRFTLVYLAAPGDEDAQVELTYNWPDANGEVEQYGGGRNFGHIAYGVSDIYAACERLQQHGLEVLTPDEADREVIHRVIYEELCLGHIRGSSREEYRRIMAALVDQGAEAIILGCTEISLLVGSEDARVPLFDTTALHARRAAEAALD